MQSDKNRHQGLVAIILAMIGSGSLVSTTVNVEVADPVTPPSQRDGWAGAELASEGPPATQLSDLVAGAEWGSSEGAQVYLWEYAQRINGGEHFPTFRQETGDCVSMGAANAINYLQAVQIAQDGANHRFRPAYQPWIYGVSRTAEDIGAGKLGRSAGSVGRWAAETVQRYGVLPADADGVPDYSGQIADAWGYRGVPDEFFDDAEGFTVATTAQVRSYEDVRDAIASGYPVTVASNRGFRMQPREHRGRMWGVPSGQWNHQMCFIGVDDQAESPRGRGGVYCLNSWGANAHGKPLNGEPPGGFWIDRQTVDAMVRQGDSWAFADFKGFRFRDLDFRIFGDEPQPIEVVDVVDIPEPPPLYEPICEAYGVHRDVAMGGGALAFLGAGLAGGLALHRRSRRRPSRHSAA